MMKTLDEKTTTTTTNVIRSAMEHIIRGIFFTLLAAITARSALHSSSYQSCFINASISLFLLWMGAKSEIDLAIKRIQRKLPPGCVGFPVIREIKFLASIATGGYFQSLQEARYNYGTVFTQALLGRIIVVLGGQENLSWLFLNDRKAQTEVSWNPGFRKLLGPRAVGNQSGKCHRVLRRLMEPYFAPTFVKNYFDAMNQITLDELDNWCHLGELQSSVVFKMYALRVFYASSFGHVDEKMLRTIHDDFKVWLGGLVSPMTVEIPGTPFAEAMKARTRLLDAFDKLVDQFQTENPEDSERAQTTIIGRFIYGNDKDNKPMMTRDEIKDNILNIVFGGHDTTYISISTLLYHLSRNSDTMEALTDEVSALKDPFLPDDLKNAPVLNACIYESWQMDPPVIGGFRKAVKEIRHHNGYKFPPGTVFNYSVLLATADKNLYKRHHEFRIGRFLPKDHPLHCPEAVDSSGGIDPSQGRTSYPVFGGGTHACLGKSFAQLEMRVLVARMFKRYRLEVRNAKKEYLPVNGWSMEFKLTEKKGE